MHYSLDDDIEERTLSANELEEESEMPDVNITVPMDTNVTQGEQDMDISYSEDVESLEHKAESCQDRNKRLLQEMKTSFTILNNIEKRNSVCNEHYQQDRVIVDIPLLLELSNKCYQTLSCSGKSIVLNTKMEGGVLTVSWKCSEGHIGCWKSSRVLCQHGGQDIFVISMLIAAGVLISGNSFDKVALFGWQVSRTRAYF